MKTSDFDFTLPEELIARFPLPERSASRMLCVENNGVLAHRDFSSLPELLNENDLLIFNDTRVIPARLYARKQSGGKVEILVERIFADHRAVAFVKSNKALRLPCTIHLENNIPVTIYDKQDGLFLLEFHSQQTVQAILNEVGEIPLPPYLQREVELSDQERYQTVYAAKEGAVAAPTAGLHFDKALMQKLKEKGVQLAFITLHVGAGTFKPILVEDITQHQMHTEIFEITPEVCELVQATRARGGRVIAVGTTTVRALETAMQGQDTLKPYKGETNIFIYPGYQFRTIDALITNFHLPRSTLLMLVCALGGYEEVMASYREAVKEAYRFFSYGDAMWILPKVTHHEI